MTENLSVEPGYMAVSGDESYQLGDRYIGGVLVRPIAGTRTLPFKDLKPGDKVVVAVFPFVDFHFSAIVESNDGVVIQVREKEDRVVSYCAITGFATHITSVTHLFMNEAEILAAWGKHQDWLEEKKKNLRAKEGGPIDE